MYVVILYFCSGAMILSVAEATDSITDWNYLALLLGISEADLQRIQNDHKESSHQQKAIVTKWLDSGNASWATLVSALRNKLVGKGALANTIAEKHPKSKPVIKYTSRCIVICDAYAVN